MTNSLLLREKIAKAGFKIGFVADKLSITYAGFFNKLNNQSEFKASEIVSLKELLNLTVDEVNAIFFNENVEKKEAK